jgi:4'-phosphopantetheinyl transferase
MSPENERILWLTRSLADLPVMDEWLSDWERRRVAALRVSKRRHEWILGRWTAKVAIAAYLARTRRVPALALLEIHSAPDGAPVALLNQEPVPVSLSLSHSAGLGFCVVTSPEISVGCDLEQVEPRDESFVRDYFTGEEAALVAQAPAGRRALLVTLIWSAKESVLKALRQGLRRDTRSVVVSLGPSAAECGWEPFAARCLETSRTFHGWWSSKAGYVFTVATDVACEEPVEAAPHP